MKENVLKLLLGLLVFFIFTVILGGIAFQRIQCHRTLKMLNNKDSQHIVVIRIYPRVIYPVGTPVNFSNSNQIVEEFFQAVSDFRYSSLGYHTVASDAHSWFMDILIQGRDMIQISCYIPCKGDFVFGEVSKIGKHNIKWNYGAFKSHQLFRWYQKYSHLWLSPVESVPDHSASH